MASETSSAAYGNGEGSVRYESLHADKYGSAHTDRYGSSHTDNSQPVGMDARKRHHIGAEEGQGGSVHMSMHARYRQIKRFKGGVMGTVFRAQDMASKGLYREVVVKLLQSGATQERQERFLREAKIVAGLQHPNIIGYIDMGHERDGTHYIVMESVNGPDLQHVLDVRGFLDERETLAISKGVLSGLACTHALRVVHRDLKPANILLVINGDLQDAGGRGRRSSATSARKQLEILSVKIIDFGLARELASSSLLTGENVVGTPMYFAPEQTISGADISILTDIWAVGVLIFHCITGKYLSPPRPPFCPPPSSASPSLPPPSLPLPPDSLLIFQFHCITSKLL